jgi:hypothetical protein
MGVETLVNVVRSANRVPRGEVLNPELSGPSNKLIKLSPVGCDSWLRLFGEVSNAPVFIVL